jgi:hypothetical protein
MSSPSFYDSFLLGMKANKINYPGLLQSLFQRNIFNPKNRHGAILCLS